MKTYKFVGTLTYYKRLNSSINGNPAFYGEFENKFGETLKGRTASDALCGYSFLNQCEKAREIKYHITRAGNIIFDYINVVE